MARALRVVGRRRVAEGSKVERVSIRHRMSEIAIAVPSAVKPASRPKIRKTPTVS
jgi:hypothetical protein